MAVKIHKGRNSLLDLTPMIDVVFNLLIFFLVATRFADEDRELDVTLASASEARPLTAQAEDVFLNIDQQGRFFVDGRIMPGDEVEAYLRQKLVNNPASLAVKIRPDMRAPLPSYVTAVDICTKVGIRDAALVTQDQQGN
jgi:biopolymer transport protein ExbD